MRRRSHRRPGSPRPRRPATIISATPGPVRALTLLVLAATLGACGDTPVDAPPQAGPVLYLVLGERTVDAARASDPTPRQHAVLMTFTSASDPLTFRDAVRFAMENPRGSRFGWEKLDRSGSASWGAGSAPMYPNWVLHDDPWAGLGALDLVPGQRYTLAIDSEGVLIHGVTTLPGAIDADFTPDSTALAWAPVPGADGYRVLIDGTPTFVTDSLFPLAPVQRHAATIVVDALEPNAWAFLTDRAQTAGIDAGYGVFGGITSDTIR